VKFRFVERRVMVVEVFGDQLSLIVGEYVRWVVWVFGK
jgi:hypothetical protein